jgi:hypothetical protein
MLGITSRHPAVKPEPLIRRQFLRTPFACAGCGSQRRVVSKPQSRPLATFVAGT